MERTSHSLIPWCRRGRTPPPRRARSEPVRRAPCRGPRALCANRALVKQLPRAGGQACDKGDLTPQGRLVRCCTFSGKPSECTQWAPLFLTPSGHVSDPFLCSVTQSPTCSRVARGSWRGSPRGFQSTVGTVPSPRDPMLHADVEHRTSPVVLSFMPQVMGADTGKLPRSGKVALNAQTHRRMEEGPRDHRGHAEGTRTQLGMPGVAGGAGRSLRQRLRRELGPAHTWVSDFWPPGEGGPVPAVASHSPGISTAVKGGWGGGGTPQGEI